MGLKGSLQKFLNRLLADSGNGQGPVAEPEADLHESIAKLESKLEYRFTDTALVVTALLHRSHIQVTKGSRMLSNERLEFLGDAVLGLVVNQFLYHRYPDRAEGDLTKMKSLLVCGSRLSEVAGDLDLGRHIRMSRSEAATGGRHRSSILADTMEALIGAVFLDGGLAAATRVVERVVLVDSDDILSRPSFGNYKSKLQEIIQARFKSPPRYRVLSADGPDHARLFKVGVVFNGVTLGYGIGRNKKGAEQMAAAEALQQLEKNPELLAHDGD